MWGSVIIVHKHGLVLFFDFTGQTLTRVLGPQISCPFPWLRLLICLLSAHLLPHGRRTLQLFATKENHHANGLTASLSLGCGSWKTKVKCQLRYVQMIERPRDKSAHYRRLTEFLVVICALNPICVDEFLSYLAGRCGRVRTRVCTESDHRARFYSMWDYTWLT